MGSKYFVYILFSESLNKFYIGFTSISPDIRLTRHLSEYYQKKAFTSVAKDWIIFWSLECKSENQARNIEKHIKKMKSIKYIRDLAQYQDISKKLFIKYS